MAPIPPWADLPQELLSTISNFLTSNPLDILTFRSVCKSWNSSFTATPYPILSPTLPLIIPSPPAPLLPLLSSSHEWCILSVTIIYSFRPPLENPLFGPNIWLCCIDQFNKEKLSIRQPFSTRSYSMPSSFPKTLNLLDFHASELGRFYNLIALYGYNPSVKNLAKLRVWSEDAVKVILLSNLSAAVTLTDEGKLGLIRLGVGELESSAQWEIIHNGKKFRFDDILEFKGMILGVDRRGRVYDIGLNHPFTIDPIVPPIAGGGGRRKRLVESLGKLYLVVRCYVLRKEKDVRVAFKVYQLLFDGKKKKWGQVTDFGDRIFFFDLGFSLSVSTQQLGGGCRKNCIVYTEHSFQNYNGDNDDYKIFHNLKISDLRIGVCHLEEEAHIGAIGSYPSYSGLLWPPPSWICPISNLKCLLEVEAAVDRTCTKVHDCLKESLVTKAAELEKEEQNKSEARLYGAERIMEVSGIIAKKSLEAVEQNMKAVEENRIRAHETQKQLEKFHQLYQSNCSIPSTPSQSGEFHDPCNGSSSL